MIWETGIWRDLRAAPQALRARPRGISEASALISSPAVKRLVVSGNGASLNVAHVLSLASLSCGRPTPDVTVVPPGLISSGAFAWREGDVLLAISLSGEFRDLVEAVTAGLVSRVVTLTANPTSTLALAADLTIIVDLPTQRAVTHTCAFCVTVAAVLDLWADVSDDDSLREDLAQSSNASSRAICAVEAWGAELFPTLPNPAAMALFGSGQAWAGAREGALIIKEVAQLPCEADETREAATGLMTATDRTHLVMSLNPADDPAGREAEAIFQRRGATVLRPPGVDAGPSPIAAITVLPAIVAVAAELASRRNRSPDSPDWVDDYYLAARTKALSG